MFCASSCQPHPTAVCVNAMSTVVLSALTPALVGAGLFMRHNACHMC